MRSICTSRTGTRSASSSFATLLVDFHAVEGVFSRRIGHVEEHFAVRERAIRIGLVPDAPEYRRHPAATGIKPSGCVINWWLRLCSFETPREFGLRR